MYILTHESTDKKHRQIENITPNDLELLLEQDRGYIEVIPMRDPSIYVRIYFDVDQYDIQEDKISEVMRDISTEFRCGELDWAIASSNRPDKISYHITSTKYCIKLSLLRTITKKLASIHSCIDTRPLYFGIADEYECGYFRLPNQSKTAIHKIAPPLNILRGSISDFFVTNVSGLSCI
jgi:formyltetrahydrofolate hydrolase